MPKLKLRGIAKSYMAGVLTNKVDKCALVHTSVDVGQMLSSASQTGMKEIISVSSIIFANNFQTDNSVATNNPLAFSVLGPQPQAVPPKSGEKPIQVVFVNSIGIPIITIPITQSTASQDTYLYINKITIEMKGDGE